MIYNPSKRNPQSWFFTGLNDSRLKNADDADSNGSDGFSVSGDIRLGVMTTAGYNESDIELDHDKCKSQGYMMSPNDWRDVEMTIYVKLDSGRCSLYTRSGTHSSRKCEGTKYTVALYENGRMRCAIEEWHNSGYTYWDEWNVGNVGGKMVGFKFICYNDRNDQNVIIETWMDMNGNNQWSKVRTSTDNGVGEHSDTCSSQEGLVMTWGGPFSTFRCDGANLDAKWFSVREVDPLNRFGGGGTSTPGGPTDPNNPNDPGTDPDVDFPGGTDGGGVGGGDGSGGTGGGTNSPQPPPAPPPVVYVRKQFGIYYGIDAVLGDPCSLDAPSADSAFQEIYEAPADNIYADTLNYRRIGIYINTSKSVFAKKKLRNAKVTMKKSNADTLTGFVYLRIRNSKGTIVEEFPNPVPASNITENDLTFEFSHFAPLHTIEKSDSIYIEYPVGGDTDTYIRVKLSGSDKADGENSVLVTHDGSIEAINLDKDLAGSFSI
jgi:hypothetical protein